MYLKPVCYSGLTITLHIYACRQMPCRGIKVFTVCFNYKEISLLPIQAGSAVPSIIIHLYSSIVEVAISLIIKYQTGLHHKNYVDKMANK